MFRWQSFHLLPQTNLLQRVRSMHRFNCVFIWSEQCLPLSGFCQDENPTVCATRVQQQRSSAASQQENVNFSTMHKTKNNKKCYTCTRHEQHKSHRIYQIFQEVSSISYLTHSSLTNFSSSGASVFSNSSGSSISRVAIFAFHFSLRAFFFLRGKGLLNTPICDSLTTIQQLSFQG